jgi:hypothetical protein
MEASSMLDVLHYFFEEDFTYVSDENMTFNEVFRTNVYKEFYKKEYQYVRDRESSSGLDSLEGPLNDDISDVSQEKINVFSPREKSAKQYVPPSEMTDDDARPFGSVLDSPIN